MSAGTLVLSLPPVQTKIAQYATHALNKNFGTRITIDKVGLSLFTLNVKINGVYIQDDQQDTLLYVRRLKTSLLNLRGILTGNMTFGTLTLEGLSFTLKTYKGETESNLDRFIGKLDDGHPRPPDTPPFRMTAKEIHIKDGEFKLLDENQKPEEILHFTQLAVAAEKFQIRGPDVTLGIRTLAMNTSWGIPVKQLSTDFTYTPSQMGFKALQLQTGKSTLKADLLFNYKREELKDFTDRVTLTAAFTPSTIALEELNLFYDAFGAGKTLLVSGAVRGTLNALKINDLNLQSGNTKISGDLAATQLFSKANPFTLTARIKNLTSGYGQLQSLLPGVLGKTMPGTLQRLGQFSVAGEARLTQTALKANLAIHTALGKGRTDLQITDIQSLNKASYKGTLSLTDFDLGTFSDTKRLGAASLEVQVAGRGFTAESLNTRVTGKIHSLEYNQYTYQQLNVSGLFKNQLFDGLLESRDENCTFSFKGLADFGKQENQFNFKASVDHADLNRLHFIRDSLSVFKGQITMNIRGTTLDNMSGQLRFYNATYQNQQDTYYLEDFSLTATLNPQGVRTLHVNAPDMVTGYLKGKFKVNEIGRLFQNAAGSLYSHYQPFAVEEGQYLDFNFSVYSKIAELLLPGVLPGPNTFIRGNLHADEGNFNLTFTSPRIRAFGNTFSGIALQVDKNPTLNTVVSIAEVTTGYYTLKDVTLTNTSRQDTLFFQTKFKGGTDAADAYDLNLYHTFNNTHKSVLGFQKSGLTFKGNTWLINKDNNSKNKVIFDKRLDSITVEELVMDHNNTEQLRLKGQLADSTYKDIDLEFHGVSLSKITPAVDSLQLNGSIEGSFRLLQKESKYLPTARVQITDFAVNTFRLGDLEIGLFGNNDLSRFGVNTWLKDKGREKMSINGNISNTPDGQELNLSANFTDFALEPFQPLAGELLSNIRGKLNGSAKISGALSNPAFHGTLTLNKAGMGISYLNVDYNFAPYSRIQLSDQTFTIDHIQLSDTVEGTTAVLSGTLTHTGFADWALNLKVDTRGKRFMMLNTPYNKEALYYGTAFINGTGSIVGPLHALTISVEAATARGTSLKIPLSDVTSIGDYSFITFIEKGTPEAVKEHRVLKEYQGLEMAFDLAVTPEAEVEIVVDQNTGSSLKGTGEGLLLIEINTNGKFNMYGDFVVVTGLYHFKYGGVIDKKFKVRPGGTILWQRDPLQAQLNIEAVYTLNANPAPLLDNPNFTGRIPTEVVVRLNGELESPNIDFDINFPTTNSVVQSELQYRLQDPTLKERNAFFLLAQGSFANAQSNLNQQAVTGNLLQTASGLLNQILEGKDDKFNLGVSYEQGIASPNADVKTENRIGVTVSTQLSDRILVNGKVGVPVGGVSETIVAGNVEIQILLNEKGSLSAKIFNRENQIQQFLTERQGYTQGVGLSYQVDFNSFRELLQKIVGNDTGKN